MKSKLNEIIFGTHTKAGRNFDLVLLVMIVFSILIILIESVPEWRLNYGIELHVLEWIFTILFSIEYILRVLVAPHPWKYMKSFWGIIDLVSISYIEINSGVIIFNNSCGFLYFCCIQFYFKMNKNLKYKK